MTLAGRSAIDELVELAAAAGVSLELRCDSRGRVIAQVGGAMAIAATPAQALRLLAGSVRVSAEAVSHA